MKNKKKNISKSRRNFLKSTALASAASVTGFSSSGGKKLTTKNPKLLKNQNSSNGETLYNGIRLTHPWPPRNMSPNSYDPMPLNYLSSPPDIIPIDIGRQLFVDDFIIEKTNLKRVFHQPKKHEANPLLSPETKVELNSGYCPVAAPFSDGCFFDPKDQLFKMWYMAGWFDGTALATSKDGIHWDRPNLDVVPGTNLVLPPGESRDGVSVWIDHEASDPSERYKMYRFERIGTLGEKLVKGAGYILTSEDGIHWNWRGKIGKTGDNSTFFYNPFRKKWVFTVRAFGRQVPPWDPNTWNGSSRGRARSYWENSDFLGPIDGWKQFEPVFWLGMDRNDMKRANYDIGREPQLYKLDAVGYESIMIGLIQTHYGPPNTECAKEGFPKLTELQLAYSRDGFHWDRTNRDTFIGGTLNKDSWERAYIHSIGGVCNIVDDKLYFYYSAFKGDDRNRHDLQHWSGMYANGSTGLAILRRDGFASMDANDDQGTLLTRKISSNGKFLFVNVEGSKGELSAEICDEFGHAIKGYEKEKSLPLNINSTKKMMTWKGKKNLGQISGKTIRIKFFAKNLRLYSFWISKNKNGVSGGSNAAGGPGLSGNWDI